MSDAGTLPGSISESLLTCMAYTGAEAAPILAVITPDLFEGAIYQDIASRILEYRARFKEPPAPAHLDDIFDHVLDDPDHKHYRAYNRILVGMREQSRTLNVKYLVDRVVAFARSQRLKTALIEAGERYSQGGEGRDDEVETILQDALKHRVETLDFGERLSAAPLSFLDRDEILYNDRFKIGIAPLDQRGIVPYRRELFMLMGRRGYGKSWFLQHLARAAVRQQWNVVHISLENRVERVKQRYMQAWFSAGKRREKFIFSNFHVDKHDKIDIDFEVLEPRLVLGDPKDRAELERSIRRHRHQLDRLVIKEFPSGFLTIPMLERWLDGLEASEGFIPDLLLVDMPQLMRLDPRDVRGSLSQTTINLRRLAGERNIAVAAVLQANRSGETAKVLRTEHSSEDISQAATADQFLTLNQTEAEHRLGLARLFVQKARNDLDRFTILISQSYTTGQFAMPDRAVLMRNQDYWQTLDEVDTAASHEKLGGRPEPEIYDDDDVTEAAD